MEAVLDFLTGASPYNAELRTFGMAMNGAMTVRNGPNKDKQMPWFYAFSCTLVTAFAGGIFGFMWMGKPTSLITGGDVTLNLTLIAFLLATYAPMDIGRKIGNNIVGKVIITIIAQLFKALGMISFIDTATAEVSASKYYPTPILGPVLYGTLLGNMGAFFGKGFHGHLEKGAPFPIQNGIIVGFLYQVYANDAEGTMGNTLRSFVQKTGIQGSLDDKTFATFCASLFIIISGVLMLPEFLGGAFNPFFDPPKYAKSFVIPSSSGSKKPVDQGDTDTETDEEPSSRRQNQRRKPKKKKKTN